MGDHRLRHAQEQSRLHDGRGSVERGLHFVRVFDPLLEPAVQDVVPAVGEKRRPVIAQPEGRPGAQRLQRGPYRAPTEGHHLHGERPPGAQAIHQLALVHHDDHSIAHRRHDLLPEQRATQPLDQVQTRIHLIGPVQGQIQPRAVVQADERDPQPLCLVPRIGRGGHPRDPAQLAPVTTRCNGLQDQPRGGAGAQAQLHAVLHHPGGALGGLFLELVLSQAVTRPRP
jgi:hypothetical protein